MTTKEIQKIKKDATHTYWALYHKLQENEATSIVPKNEYNTAKVIIKGEFRTSEDFKEYAFYSTPESFAYALELNNDIHNLKYYDVNFTVELLY